MVTAQTRARRNNDALHVRLAKGIEVTIPGRARQLDEPFQVARLVIPHRTDPAEIGIAERTAEVDSMRPQIVTGNADAKTLIGWRRHPLGSRFILSP